MQKNLLLILLFTFHFSLDTQAQNKEGYVVLLEGDTLLGKVKISATKPIKFYQNEEQTVYPKKDLLDYGYYSEGKYISKPERIPPASKKTTLADIVMTRGDTLYGCYVKKCDLDFLEVYVEYPKKEIFPVTEGKVTEVIMYMDPYVIHIDAIHLMHNMKKGDFYPGYAIRAIDGRLRQYNGRTPFSTISIPAVIGSMIRPATQVALEATFDVVVKANIDKWIVYKDGKSYRFNNFNQWEKIRPDMFAEDEGFNEYLEEKNYNQRSIETVLHAYNLYWQDKSLNND